MDITPHRKTPSRRRRRRRNHDGLFKELLQTFFLEFLELFYPEVAAYVEPCSVEFLDKETFSGIPGGDNYEADVVARVAFRGSGEHTRGIPATFLIHLEPQGKEQNHFPERMFIYFAGFYARHRLPIYPIAIFHYASPLKAADREFCVSFPAFEVLRFRFQAVQLNQCSWRDFLKRRNPVAAALMSRMRIERNDRPKVKAECLRLIATLKLDPARQKFIAGFVDVSLGLKKSEVVRFEQEVAKFQPEEENTVRSMMTSWEKQGKALGIAEGRALGVAEGLKKAIKLNLGLRFGVEGLALAQRLPAGVDVPDLERLAERVMTATSLEELERDA